MFRSAISIISGVVLFRFVDWWETVAERNESRIYAENVVLSRQFAVLGGV